MIVYTDSLDYAGQVLGQGADGWSAATSFPTEGIRRVIARAYGDHGDGASRGAGAAPLASRVAGPARWRHLALVESAPRSHYDLLIEVSRELAAEGIALTDDLLLLAGAGERFHGFRGRAWSAAPGNIHLSVHLAPRRPIERPGTSFTVLAAVSMLDAIDRTPGLDGRAGIKWVNDVLIDGAKVGGVLAYFDSEGGLITGVVLGIGLNVETDPVPDPTPYVPRARSLRGCSPDPSGCTQGSVFGHLIEALDRNYRRLLDGGYRALLDRYRQRSLVIGREVTICTDDSGPECPDVLASGRVSRMGDDLELTIEGFGEPFAKGRLILG